MTVTEVSKVNGTAPGATQLTLTLNGVTAGDMLVLMLGWNLVVTGETPPASFLNVSDTGGNTWARADGGQVSSGTGSTGQQLAYFFCKVTTGGDLTVTANLQNGPPTDFNGILVDLTSSTGGTLQYGGLFKVHAGKGVGGNTQFATPEIHNVSYLIVNGMSAGASTATLESGNASIYKAVTSASASFLYGATRSGTDGSGSVGLNSGYHFASGTQGWASFIGLVVEFPPTVCTSPPTGASIALCGTAAGFADGGPGTGFAPYNDPVVFLLQNVPEGAAIVVVAGKTPLNSADYSLASVTDSVGNAYTRVFNQGDGPSPAYVSIEIWVAGPVKGGNYSLSIALQHNDAAIEDTPLLAMIFTGPQGSELAFDRIGNYNGDNLAPSATEGTSSVTTVLANDQVPSAAVALVGAESGSQWQPSADSNQANQAMSSVGTITLGGFKLKTTPNPPGTYTTTQPWVPTTTNNWVSVSLGVGANVLLVSRSPVGAIYVGRRGQVKTPVADRIDTANTFSGT
jgi:hypothetical protein